MRLGLQSISNLSESANFVRLLQRNRTSRRSFWKTRKPMLWVSLNPKAWEPTGSQSEAKGLRGGVGGAAGVSPRVQRSKNQELCRPREGEDGHSSSRFILEYSLSWVHLTIDRGIKFFQRQYLCLISLWNI